MIGPSLKGNELITCLRLIRQSISETRRKDCSFGEKLDRSLIPYISVDLRKIESFSVKNNQT